MFQKLTFFCLTVLLEGGAFSCLSLGFCYEIKHPKTVTFCGKLKIFLDFLLHFSAFRHFFEKFNTFWYNIRTIKRASQLYLIFFDIF
jgi:hypothetical protein